MEEDAGILPCSKGTGHSGNHIISLQFSSVTFNSVYFSSFYASAGGTMKVDPKIAHKLSKGSHLRELEF